VTKTILLTIPLLLGLGMAYAQEEQPAANRRPPAMVFWMRRR